MSHIDKIIGELGALMTGVEKAQEQAAAADSRAGEIALRAAGAGFAAVAASLVRVREAVAGIQSHLRGLAGSISTTTKAVGAVPHEATPQETIAGLTPVRNAIDGIRETTAGTITQVGEVQRLVTVILQGGQPGPMLSALESVKQILVLVAQRTATAGQQVEAAIAEAQQLGSAGN